MQAKHKNPAQRKRTSAMQLELNNLRKTYLLPAAVWQQIGVALIAQSKIHNQLKLSALLLAMRSKSNLYPHDYS